MKHQFFILQLFILIIVCSNHLSGLSRKPRIILKEDIVIVNNTQLDLKNTALIKIENIGENFSLSNFDVNHIVIKGIESNEITIKVDYFQTKDDKVTFNFKNNKIDVYSSNNDPVYIDKILVFIPKNISIKVSSVDSEIEVEDLYRNTVLNFELKNCSILLKNIFEIDTLEMTLESSNLVIKLSDRIKRMNINLLKSNLNIERTLNVENINFIAKNSNLLIEKSEISNSIVLGEDSNINFTNCQITNLSLDNKKGNINLINSEVKNLNTLINTGNISFSK